MPIWGPKSTEGKPNYRWLTRGHGNTANVFATERGWVHRWPWGDEVLIGIGQLNEDLGVPNLADVFVADTPVVNAAAQTLRFLLQFNEAVNVNGTPTVVAIAADANVANVTLSYVAADSDPSSGKLVFQNANVALEDADVGGTFTVNSSSIVSGWDGITDAVTANAVANGVPAGLSASVTIEEA